MFESVHDAIQCAVALQETVETISVTELPAQEAAPVLKQYLLRVSAGVRSYFDARKDAPFEAFEREALRHPVFQITAMESLQK